MKIHRFELEFPLNRTHCGIPLANGNMGVLVWGHDHCLCVTVNRSDFWDHRFGEHILPGQSYQQMVDTFDPEDIEPTNHQFVRQVMPLDEDEFWWRPTRLPAGQFEFVLDDPLARASLDYHSGVLDIITRTGRRLQMVISRTCHQLLVQDSGRLIISVQAKPAWEWVGSTLLHAGFEPPVLHYESGITGWFQSCPQDLGLTAVCMQLAGEWCISLTREKNPLWLTTTVEWNNTLVTNRQFWEQYWATVPRVNLPTEPWLERFYQFALYKFACATDPAPGIGVASGLQGPWIEEYQKTPWSGDYHFNVNIQQIYTLALSIGAYEHMHPLFDMLESEPFVRVMRENARNLMGIEDGLLLTHAVDDRGKQCGGIAVGSALDFACGGWMAQLYWLYYQHTQDVEFLRKRALPFMRGVMRVYEAAIREYKGRLSIPLSISAEYGCTFPVMINGKARRQNAGRDPSNQLICAHMLTQALLDACAILNIKPEPIWLDIQKRLPQHTLNGAPEAEHIMLWEGQDLDVCHRHHSHLAGVYPFATYDPSDHEQVRIMNNTIDHWIMRGMGQWSEWCYPWAAIIQARMGFSEAPIQLLRLWRELFINEGWATVYLPKFRGLTAHRRDDMNKPKASHEIMQLDGTMAGATAILELLVHQQGGVIHLFRGIPEHWTETSFEQIRLPGGLCISASMHNGKLEHVTINGPTKHMVQVAFRGQTSQFPCLSLHADQQDREASQPVLAVHS